MPTRTSPAPGSRTSDSRIANSAGSGSPAGRLVRTMTRDSAVTEMAPVGSNVTGAAAGDDLGSRISPTREARYAHRRNPCRGMANTGLHHRGALPVRTRAGEPLAGRDGDISDVAAVPRRQA